MDVRLHHVGIVVADIRATIGGYLKSFGASWDGRIFHDPRPLPAVAFENRRIAWVFTREKLLLEFLESNGDESRA